LANRKTKSEEDLLIAFDRCSKKVRERFNAILDSNKFPLTYDQWLILKEISKSQGQIQRSLAHKLAKEPASISRICSKLIFKEYITKVPSEDNKKAFKLYLSPKGTDLVNEFTAVSNKMLIEIFNGIYEREISFINDILLRINQNFEEKKVK